MNFLPSFVFTSRTDRAEDDLIKPVQYTKKRTKSDGEFTACEDWSDIDDAQSSESEAVPIEKSNARSSGNKTNVIRAPLSRFNVFHKSEPESINDRIDDYDHNEQMPSAQETGRLRHITRPLDDGNRIDNKHSFQLDNSLNTREQTTSLRDNARNPYQAKEKSPTSTTQLDIALFAAYLCSCVVLAFPVMILPTAAAELASGSTSASVAAFVASVASIATFGAGVGKFINGFVCKWWGGQQSSFFYLIGMALCSIYLSKTSSNIGLAMAGIEFFSSIQFTSMALVLSNHYERDPTKLTAGMTTVSFGSTGGMLVANALGAALLHHCHWRTVAQVGAAIALLGAFIVYHCVKDFPCSMSGKSTRVQHERLDIRGVVSSLKHVLGSGLFWQVGIAHAMAFLARTSDRLLSAFFREATLLPRNVCGGLLACLAFGYIHGLSTGRKIAHTKHTADKTRILRKRYTCAVLSALSLAICANKTVSTLLREQSNLLLVFALTLSCGAMTSFLAFQIYLLPTMVANTFGKNKPVCLSFLDGLGYFLASPIWATTSQIVSHPLLEPHGWSLAWTMLALIFAVGGGLMMRAIPPVLHVQHASEAGAKEQQSENASEITHLA